MEKVYTYNQTSYTITRYPKTEDRTLKAWSNAEVYALDKLKESQGKHIVLYNDRFGFWNTCLNTYSPTTVWHYASQKKAVKQNLEQNRLVINEESLFTVFDQLEKPADIALVKIPKSVDAFEHILEHICVINGKHFNFVTVTKTVEPGKLVYGEYTEGPPMVDELFQFYVITPLTNASCKVELHLYWTTNSFLKTLAMALVFKHTFIKNGGNALNQLHRFIINHQAS